MTRRTQLSLLSSIALYVMLSAISEVPADDSVVTKALSTSSSNEQSIKRALNDKTSFDFQGVPLSDAMQSIAEKHHILIQIDNNALKAAGIDPTTTQVTMGDITKSCG